MERKEHPWSPTPGRIAADHLKKEHPCYYSKGLIPLERKLARMK